MWFRTLLDLFPSPRPRKPRTSADRRRQARKLLFEPLDARRVLAFSPFSEMAAGGSAVVQVAGDFTGDGQQDLVVNNAAGVQLFAGNGDGTFQAPATLSGTWANSVAAGDLDADG